MRDSCPLPHPLQRSTRRRRRRRRRRKEGRLALLTRTRLSCSVHGAQRGRRSRDDWEDQERDQLEEEEERSRGGVWVRRSHEYRRGAQRRDTVSLIIYSEERRERRS